MSHNTDIEEQLLGDDAAARELMNLFKEKSYWERFSFMMRHLGSPKDSKEYKQARIELQRQAAPICAVLIPIILLAFVAYFSAHKSKDEVAVEMEIIEEQEVEEIIEEPPIEEEPPLEEFTPTDVFSPTPNTSMDISTPAPDAPVSAQPQTFDTVLTVKSPVILRNIYGSTRNAGARGRALAGHGGNPRTEAAVMRALRWLKVRQSTDGSWPSHRVAMTSLALLTFLAHGETPGDSAEFGETVQRGIEYLLSVQNPTTGLFDKYVDGNNYSHPIATYALCEAYGMTQNPNVRIAADKALDHIIKGQHPEGGWDYKMAQTDRNDTSYMGWCAQAIKAAQMADFYHDPAALEQASKLSVRGFKNNGYPDGGFGYVGPQKAGLTGVGVLCLQFHHAERDPFAVNSLQNIVYNWVPEWVGSSPANITKERPKDAPQGIVGGGSPQYYYYYGTQAVFQSGGEHWKQWNARMWPSYTKAQFITPKGSTTCNCGFCNGQHAPYVDANGKEQEIGHWVNTDAHSDRPVMDTCLAALQLMVYYRYLPTFKQITVPEEVVAKPVETGDIEVETNL